MDHKLLLIEGIPGSGKTTVAKKLKQYLESKGEKVMMYQEGELHPADVAWCSILSLEDYEDLLLDYPEHANLLRQWSSVEKDYAIVAYTRLGFYPDQNSLMTYLASKECYQGKVSFDAFKEIHFTRWHHFAETADPETIYIFECVFFQNHIVELLGEHDLDPEVIKSYLIELSTRVIGLNPKLIYLSQSSINETIDRVAKERVSEDLSKWRNWIDLVIEYVDDMNFSKNRSQTGYAAAIDFFEARKRIEILTLEALKMDQQIVDNSDYDINALMRTIVESL